MVSTRGRPRTHVDGREATASMADQPERVKVVMMNEAMAKHQESLLKIFDDRDVSNRRNETVAENIQVIVFGGTVHVNQTEEPIINEVSQGKRACSYKSFLCCKPPEFSGSEDPVACMKWIQGIKQGFNSSECEEGQRVRFGSQMLRDTTLTW
ncbi:hypothetical protein L6452_34092 [Arctium lappa]|uniref:Uncharacterized protein n=1 Tax=Arctium lappa TaxID=4217 RepID=A0ACB8YLG8_ARCLA|nr:hypothetical protein L6452_34092 [Arctium lappa]